MTQSVGGTSWDIRSLLATPMGVAIFWFFVLFWTLAVLIPIGRVLRRTGHSPLWSVFFLVPGANVLALWVFAVKPWPVGGRGPDGTSAAPR